MFSVVEIVHRLTRYSSQFKYFYIKDQSTAITIRVNRIVLFHFGCGLYNEETAMFLVHTNKVNMTISGWKLGAWLNPAEQIFEFHNTKSINK